MQKVPFIFGGGDTHKYEIRYCEGWAWDTDAPSAGGQPYLKITRKYVEAGEEPFDFFERYRKQRLDMASTYADFEPIGSGGGGEYQYWEYIWQPQAGDCRYHVVEHAYPSWNAPNDYGFVISTGVCEADLPAYGQQRKDILASFEELE